MPGNFFRIISYSAMVSKLVLNLQVKNMLADFADNMHCQFFEILRSLLESLAPGSQVHYLYGYLTSYFDIHFLLLLFSQCRNLSF